MKDKHCLLIVVFLILINICNVKAQDIDLIQQQYIEDIIESLSENAEEDADISNIFSDLTHLAIKPLNLNTASEKELEKLVFLNSFQIASIMDYRKRNGTIQSVYELGYLPGFREKDILILAQFVICEEPIHTKAFKKSKYKDYEHQVILRYQRAVEKQKGYEKISDSLLSVDPNKSRYMGSPDKLYLRYGFSAGENFFAGIVMEKDAGEEFISGSNKNGFDFYSVHLLYKSEKSFIRGAAIGDYHIQLGQGLLMWSSYPGFKTSYVSQLAKRPALIKRSFSADENRFMRGGAITIGKGDLSLTLFGSHNKIDATIVRDTIGASSFSGFAATGYHNTPLEISKENQLSVDIAGMSLRFDANRLKVGVNGVYTEYGCHPLKTDILYKSYAFTDRQIIGASTDYRYLGRKSNFFGEVAWSNDALAILNGVEVYLKHGLNIGIMHRYYNPGYYSHFNSAFGENSEIANENGFFLGTEGRLDNFTVRAYGDIFSFPWLKYQVNAPSEGSEMFAEIVYSIGSSNLLFRYKRQEKPKNYSDDKNQLSTISSYKNEQFRLNATYPLGDFFKMQSRAELALAGFCDSTKQWGYGLIQDLSVANLKIPIDITFRAAWFSISDYNARIYVYEKDVLYAYSSTIYNGKGWRFACLIKWKRSDAITFYLKYSYSLYPGESAVGSGLTQINTNHRSEVKSELVFRF